MDKRITPEEVKAAYEATGLKPARNHMRPHLDGCCGLGVITLAALGRVPDGILEAYDYVWDQYGDDYTTGFFSGFDDNGLHESFSSGRHLQGYEDGKAAAALVFGEDAA